jgi:exodeoxyribonuclease VII large subunit
MRDLFSTVDSPASTALSVGELAWQIKRLLEADPILCDIAVQGEISNFTAHGSGHLYFTLKDDAAQIRCCMWRGSVAFLAFRPSHGDRVIATGHVEFYGARGEVNFIVDSLRFAGQGALFEAFERLKAELAAEGLFDAARKRPLPVMPRRIGLITSATGAGAHDVLSILRRRWPLARVLFIPAAVQGFAAAPDLMRALSWAAAIDDLDVLIIGRGGGSAEDLWAFNDEDLARAAARFPKPLISAVGHETDFTILDFVADLRASTPSAAAELVAPDIREVRALVDSLRGRLHHAVAGDIALARQRLDGLRLRRAFTHPRERLRPLHERVAALRIRARDSIRRRVKIERQGLAARRVHLRALDPRQVLERGYALVSEAGTGNLIASARQAHGGMKLNIALRDGVIAARAEDTKQIIESTEPRQDERQVQSDIQ